MHVNYYFFVIVLLSLFTSCTCSKNIEMNRHDVTYSELNLKLTEDSLNYFITAVDSLNNNYFIFKDSDLYEKLSDSIYRKVNVYITDHANSDQNNLPILFYAHIKDLPNSGSTIMKRSGSQGCIPSFVMKKKRDSKHRGDSHITPLEIEEKGFPVFVAYHPTQKSGGMRYLCGFVKVNDKDKFNKFMQLDDPYEVYIGFDESKIIGSEIYIDKFTLYRKLKFENRSPVIRM